MHRGSITRNLFAGGAAAAMLIASLTVASAQNNGVLTGVINDASGQPVTGAFVKLKNDQKRLTIWGRPNSVNVQKVLWCLRELDLA